MVTTVWQFAWADSALVVLVRQMIGRLNRFDCIAITNETPIAENFNKFFTEFGSKLAKENETSTIKFDDYLEQCNTIHCQII